MPLPPDPHDPAEQEDEAFCVWFNGLCCGVALAGAVYALAAWLGG